MKLHAIMAVFAAVAVAHGASSMTIETASPQVWLAPLDLSLGPPVPILADQLCGSVFALRSEVRQIPSSRGDHRLEYRWFIRNKTAQAVSIAVVRPQPPPINPLGRGHVYGATWSGRAGDPLTSCSLYRVRIQNATGWHWSTDQPIYPWRYTQWQLLQSEQEREIYQADASEDEPIEAALFSIPFQIDQFRGEAFLGFVRP